MLSALILSKNEGQNIGECIQALSFCDEIIVADDNSTDHTVEIAKSLNARIVDQDTELDFAQKRNRLMQQAKGDWLLFIDPDERLTKELQEEIIAILKEPKYDVYLLKRRDFFWGQEIKHGELQTAAQNGFIRLVKKGSGSWKGTVHESFETNLPTGKLSNYINHYPHPTLTEFITDINFYSTLRSKELLKKDHKTTIFEIIFLPFFKFLYTYIIKMGFLDGAAGFAYSFMMSFHSFLVRSKLYQYQHIDEAS